MRLSCGVEAPEDLVDDLRLAFERAAGGKGVAGAVRAGGGDGADGPGDQRSAAGHAMR